MKAVLAALAAVLMASGAGAQTEPLHGHWQITMPSNDGFAGRAVIDAQGRVAYLATVDSKQWPAVGYIERKAPTRVEIPLTNTTTKSVARMRCAIQSKDVLNCDTVEADGATSPQFYMRRSASQPDATDIKGRWRVPVTAEFSFQIAVDERRQFVATIPENDNFRATGYVWVDGTSVRFFFHKRTRVSRTDIDSLVCVVEATDLLRCVVRKERQNAKTSFLISRIGR